MAPNPEGFLRHLQGFGYHPRSSKHSNCLSECIVHDLIEQCRAIRRKASEGQLVYELNFTLLTGTAEWNVDLVLGEPPPGVAPPQPPKRILRTRPSTVQIAVELKTVMTEHRKAVKNRKRDFEAHHDHVHRYSQRAIAGGVMVINIAATFKSPLVAHVTEHREPESLVRHCIEQMRAVSQRSDPVGVGLDAKAVIVVNMDNQNIAKARYLSRGVAPRVGDPMHYDAFIQAICSLFTDRFYR
jgi:hypothetical protein